MPSGIIMSSGSPGATQEAIEEVLSKNGYEADKPEPEVTAEPKRDAFESDEAFEQAKEEFEAKQAEEQEAKEQEEERKAERRPSRRERAIQKATADLREENRKLNERLAALEGKAPKVEAKVPEAPKRDEFKTDAEFDEAMFDYRYKLRKAKEDTDNAQKELTDRLKHNFENYRSQVDEFKETHDDWEDVVNQTIPIHETVYLAIQELENGAQVTYYLGKHPDVAEQLAEMSPLSAAMEVGRLATRLKTGAAKNQAEAGNGAKKKTPPRLPEPVKPVSTAATASSLTSAEAAKKRDYRAFKVAQRQGR